MFCAVLATANWATIKLDPMIIGVMLPVIWFCVMWLRRRKVRELDEVTKILDEMDGKSVP